MKKKAGRNDPCPCGSGKKFKKCCERRMLGKKFMVHKIEPHKSQNDKPTEEKKDVSHLFQSNVMATKSQETTSLKEKEIAKKKESTESQIFEKKQKDHHQE